MSLFSFSKLFPIFFCFLILNNFLNANWSPAWDLSSYPEKAIISHLPVEDEVTHHLALTSYQPLSTSQNKEQEKSDFYIKPTGLQEESEQFQVISDSFGNQTAAWIYQGTVQAASRSAGEEWQATPDLLSSKDEIAQDLHLSVDSMGNALVIWQAMPSGSIQASVKLVGSNWRTDILTGEGERGVAPLIAEGPEGYVIAIWKQHDLEKMRFSEFSLPSLFFNENFSSLFLETTRLANVDSASSYLDQSKPSSSDLHSVNLVNRLSNQLLTALPSSLPLPPSHVRGHQIENRFATQVDIINVITWNPPMSGPNPLAYFIYRNRDLTDLAAMIPSWDKLKFKDHNRKSHHRYAYFLVSVDVAGNHSPPVGIIFKGSKTHVIDFISPVAIAISPMNPTIAVGATQQFVTVVRFSDGTEQTLTSKAIMTSRDSDSNSSDSNSSESSAKHVKVKVIWTSSNPAVATIDKHGLATGLTPGTTIITATADGVSASTTLTVAGSTCPPPNYTTTTLSEGVVGLFYSAQIQTTGGVAPLNFSIASGSLPPGLSLTPSSGTISGTPTMTGTFNFTVQAASSCGTASLQLFNIMITSVCPAPTITTTTLPSGATGDAYNAIIQTTEGVTPITFSISSGSLPPGLSLNSSTGTIFGTPSATGTFNFTVQATSGCGASSTQPLSISITSCPAPSFTTTTLPAGTVNDLYHTRIQTTGGVEPITFSISSGSLPPGLSLHPNTGVISGTPSATGTFNFTVQATSGCGASSTQPFSIIITAGCPAPTITTTTLPAGTVNDPYQAHIRTTGGVEPITFSISSGSLPPGLSLHPNTGVISGTPTATGTFNFIVKATNGCGASSTQPLSIMIVTGCPAPVITTKTLPDGTTGTSYSARIDTTGGVEPITFSIIPNPDNLPLGLTLNSSTGVISGTPGATGTFNFTVQATNGCGNSSTQPLSITIVPCPAPFIPNQGLVKGEVGIPYSSGRILTEGGVAPITLLLATGELPPGLTLDQTMGVISGTPTKAGTFNFALQAKSACGALSAPTNFSITICQTPVFLTSSLPAGGVGATYTNPDGTAVFIVATASPDTVQSYVLVPKPGEQLPPGLGLTQGSGQIVGQPTQAGSFSFTVTASTSCGLSVTKTFTIKVCPSSPVFQTQSQLPSGTIAVPYSLNGVVSIVATAPGETITYVALKNDNLFRNLPPGLTLASSTGSITGTPILTPPYPLPSTFNFDVVATTSCGSSAVKTFSIQINP